MTIALYSWHSLVISAGDAGQDAPPTGAGQLHVIPSIPDINCVSPMDIFMTISRYRSPLCSSRSLKNNS